MLTTGLDRILQERPQWLRRPFGLLANQASVTRDGRYAWSALAGVDANLHCLFSPQHGLWAEEQANMIESRHGRLADPDVPVFSLYGETRTPTDEMLAGIERLVVDLQDVGTRVYTFAWTVHHCLQACAERGIAVTILDRPNPLGCRVIEGPRLEMSCASFVGEAPIPMRHGMTLGQLARRLVERRSLEVELEVVPVENWSEESILAASWPVAKWIPPSPNLPTPFSTLLYPGMVLLEGTNISEGRGTTRPFEVAGAPFVNGDRLARVLSEHPLPGVRWLPIRFRPTFDKWAGECCGGVWIQVVDAEAFRPYRAAIALLAAIRNLWPSEFRWIDPPYEYETEKWPIDIISGSELLRRTFAERGEISTGAIDRLTAV